MVTVQIDLIADLQYVHFNSSATLCPSPCPALTGQQHILDQFNIKNFRLNSTPETQPMNQTISLEFTCLIQLKSLITLRGSW